MNLQSQQAMFARLVTDDAFRSDARDCVSGGRDVNDAVRLASDAGVELHAMTLKRKRLHAARHRLPLTTEVLGEAFAPLFMQFAGQSTLRTERRYDRDALAFLEWVSRETATGGGSGRRANTPGLRAAIRLERAELKARLGGRLLRVLSVDGRQLPALNEMPRRRFVVIWLRLSPKGRLRRWTIEVPFAEVRGAVRAAERASPSAGKPSVQVND